MRLRKIAVTGLYGIFDHEISLDKPEGVTIVHGPNGYGKTVMLKMISAAFDGDVEIFRNTHFKEFKIEFADGRTWRAIRQLEKSKDSTVTVNIRIVTTDAEGIVSEVQGDLEEEIDEHYLNAMDTGVPGPYNRSGKGWRDDEGRYYSVQQIIRLFPDAGGILPPSIRRQLKARPAWNLKLDVFVVEANRLESSRQFETDDARIRRQSRAPGSSEPPRPLRVQQYSRDVVQRIRSVLADYAKSSQEGIEPFPRDWCSLCDKKKRCSGSERSWSRCRIWKRNGSA